MAKVCQVTGKRPATGNNVSHANNKTKRRFLPNLHKHRFWVEKENRWVSLRVSTKGMRIIDKTPAGEATAYLLDTYPANSLRLIFDYNTLTHQAGLVPDQWVHVAATVNGETGAATLYVGGKPVKK